MEGNEQLRLLSLSDAELRVLMAMRHLVDRWGVVNATMDELSSLTGYGRTTLSKAVAGLDAAGFIQIERTKRNLGKLSKNKYHLLPCSPQQTLSPEVVEEPRSLQQTSTADTDSSNSQLTTELIKVLNTSYLIGASAKKKKEIQLVNKWQEDDDAGVFGLFEDEMKPEKPATKRDPKTRNQRPQIEWTSADVASEFAARLYSKVRGVPGLINIAKLRPVLAKYRKDYNLTPLIELEVMDMMMGDERILASVKREPHNAYKIFLKMLSTHTQKAVEVLDMEDLDTPKVEKYVYASDGKKFDNSMPGRAMLRRYEEEKGNQ